MLSRKFIKIEKYNEDKQGALDYVDRIDSSGIAVRVDNERK